MVVLQLQYQDLSIGGIPQKNQWSTAHSNDFLMFWLVDIQE